jgi:hypothetical protein
VKRLTKEDIYEIAFRKEGRLQTKREKRWRGSFSCTWAERELQRWRGKVAWELLAALAEWNTKKERIQAAGQENQREEERSELFAVWKKKTRERWSLCWKKIGCCIKSETEGKREKSAEKEVERVAVSGLLQYTEKTMGSFGVLLLLLCQLREKQKERKERRGLLLVSR